MYVVSDLPSPLPRTFEPVRLRRDWDESLDIESDDDLSLDLPSSPHDEEEGFSTRPPLHASTDMSHFDRQSFVLPPPPLARLGGRGGEEEEERWTRVLSAAVVGEVETLDYEDLLALGTTPPPGPDNKERAVDVASPITHSANTAHPEALIPTLPDPCVCLDHRRLVGSCQACGSESVKHRGPLPRPPARPPSQRY